MAFNTAVPGRALMAPPIVSSLVLLACQSTAAIRPPAAAPQPATEVEATVEPASASTDCEPARDREAIKRMAGAFKVTFEFEETEALTAGYDLHEPYTAEALEVVQILLDTPEQLVLQHILLQEGHDGTYSPLKHWRQDWTFEDRALLEFQGKRVWQRRALEPEEVRCTWSQAVYQVDDGPRYESYGHWEHDGDRATWTSRETWRPLPRREYTHRDDYDVLLATNVHISEPDAWYHKQDNRKWVLDSQTALTRETGENRYVRTELPEEAQGIAETYLQRTGPFWEDVREEWETLLAGTGDPVLVKDALDNMPLHKPLFKLAEEIAGADPHARRKQIHEMIAPYVGGSSEVKQGS